MQFWGPGGLLKLSGVSLPLFIFAVCTPKFTASPGARAPVFEHLWFATVGSWVLFGSTGTPPRLPGVTEVGWRGPGLADGHTGQAHWQGAGPSFHPRPDGGCTYIPSVEGPPSHLGCVDPSASQREGGVPSLATSSLCSKEAGTAGVPPSGPQLCSSSLWAAEVRMTLGSVRCAWQRCSPTCWKQGCVF